MNKLNLLLQKKNLVPPLIIVGCLVIAGSVAYAFAPQRSLVTKQSDSPNKVLSYQTKPTTAAIQAPQMTSSPRRAATVGTKARSVSPQPASVIPTAVAVKQNTTSASQNNTTVTNTPVPQQAAATSIPTQAVPTQTPASATVSVEITSPSGTSTFTVSYSENMTVCDVLQKAKDTGKITSVTFDDSYMATLHSKYVAEINGFANNWTFSVNGSSPLGCSLSQPKPNDTIIWKFS